MISPSMSFADHHFKETWKTHVQIHQPERLKCTVVFVFFEPTTQTCPLPTLLRLSQLTHLTVPPIGIFLGLQPNLAKHNGTYTTQQQRETVKPTTQRGLFQPRPEHIDNCQTINLTRPTHHNTVICGHKPSIYLGTMRWSRYCGIFCSYIIFCMNKTAKKTLLVCVNYLVVAFHFKALACTCMYRCNPLATRLQHVASAASRLQFKSEVTALIQ